MRLLKGSLLLTIHYMQLMVVQHLGMAMLILPFEGVLQPVVESSP